MITGGDLVLSEMITLEIKQCRKCGRKNIPKINPDGTTTPRVQCVNRNCRNILDEPRKYKSKRKQLQNLLYLKKEDVERIIAKKARIVKEVHFCKPCEMLFASALGLERHNLRRHIP